MILFYVFRVLKILSLFIKKNSFDSKRRGLKMTVWMKLGHGKKKKKRQVIVKIALSRLSFLTPSPNFTPFRQKLLTKSITSFNVEQTNSSFNFPRKRADPYPINKIEIEKITRKLEFFRIHENPLKILPSKIGKLPMQISPLGRTWLNTEMPLFQPPPSIPLEAHRIPRIHPSV